MPGPERDIVIGADGFLGRNLVPRLRAEGREVVEIGRAAGDLSDWANVERALRDAPPAGRIFHVVTRQRTGAIQYDIQGELLAINARIHLNVLEAWRLYQPQAKLVSTGSSCTYPESAEPLPEARFGQGPTHPSVIGYGLAKQVLATGSAAYAHQYGLSFLHCVLATLYGPHDNTASDRSHFVGALLDRAVREKAAGAQAFEVWGNPQTVREVLRRRPDRRDPRGRPGVRERDPQLRRQHPHHRRGGGAGGPGRPRLVRPPREPARARSRARPTRCSTRRGSSAGPAGSRASISSGPAQARRGGVRRALTSRIRDWTCLAGASPLRRAFELCADGQECPLQRDESGSLILQAPAGDRVGFLEATSHHKATRGAVPDVARDWCPPERSVASAPTFGAAIALATFVASLPRPAGERA